ncbi:ATP binding protein [Achlya hypogyna]|uniref:ATP binding protein n=1 Tax=Achlya hypogyna TaxID=1202772 RepID=A0A1V9ZNR4_ACHHY|nr:ATP binding protein [Achlya hypogyna]
MLAVKQGHNDIVALLISRGSDLNCVNKAGDTALHIAVNKGRYASVESLVRAKAHLLVQNANGETPLVLANKRGEEGMARLLARNQELNAAELETQKNKIYDNLVTSLKANGVNEDDALSIHKSEAIQIAIESAVKILSVLLQWAYPSDTATQLLLTTAIRRGHRGIADLLYRDEYLDTPMVDQAAVEMDMYGYLGRGGSGEVTRGIYRGRAVAVKCPNQTIPDDYYQNEISMHPRCRSPYILPLLATFVKNNRSHLVMPLMSHRSVKHYLQEVDPSISISIFDIAWVVANALTDLHAKGLIHRDVKADNVFVCSTHYVKLGDLGSARLYNELIMTAETGTYPWMAPEVFDSTVYNTAVDIYSFGILLSELATRRVPYDELQIPTPFALKSLVKDGTRPSLGDAPTWLLQLAPKCWAADPNDRPTASDIVATLRNHLVQFSRTA